MHVCWNVHVKGETRKRRGPGYCECHIVSSNYIQDWELHVFGFKGTKDSTKFAQTKWIILNVESFCSFKLLLVNYAQMLNFTQILEVAPVQISWQVFQ